MAADGSGGVRLASDIARDVTQLLEHDGLLEAGEVTGAGAQLSAPGRHMPHWGGAPAAGHMRQAGDTCRRGMLTKPAELWAVARDAPHSSTELHGSSKQCLVAAASCAAALPQCSAAQCRRPPPLRLQARHGWPSTEWQMGRTMWLRLRWCTRYGKQLTCVGGEQLGCLLGAHAHAADLWAAASSYLCLVWRMQQAPGHPEPCLAAAR